MPTEACLVVFECTSHRVVLRSKPGDYGIFCSFASVKRPPIKLRRGFDGAVWPTRSLARYRVCQESCSGCWRGTRASGCFDLPV